MLGPLVLLAAVDPCIAECASADLACWQESVECFIDDGRARAAVEALKPVASDPALARLLARAYAADGNLFWAQRTLHALLVADETDCESRAHLAWIDMQQARIEAARELLDQPGCPREDAERGRWRLLRAYAHDLANEASARHQALLAVSEADVLFVEDVDLYRHLRARDDPGWIEPVVARLELVAGYTSNGLAGSPTDAPTGASTGSALGRIDAVTTLVAPMAGSLRPALELGLRAHGLAADDPALREQSYLELSARPSILLGRALPRVTLAYAADLLLVNHADRGRFYEGHRAEVEVEASEWVTVFGGGGRRIFREGGRSRWEADGGVGVSLPVGDRIHLFAVTAARFHRAVDPSYHRFGGTVALVARARPGLGTQVRTGVTLGVDDYFDSGGRPENEQAFGTDQARSDQSLKVTAGVWSPPLWGARAGLRYELAWRNSTADLSVGLDNYDYTEHRVVAGLRWAWGGDPFLPRAVDGDDHVALDYGLEPGKGGDNESIRDILRQDEADRSGCSCVN